MTEKKPFLEKEYTKKNGFYPILDIICWVKDSKGSLHALANGSLRALADTGCDPGVSLSKDQVEDIDLGEKKNDDPIEIFVADGHVVGADVYDATVEINGEKKETELLVVDPTKIIRFEIKGLFPLLGRGFLNKFDVLFKGEERKLVLLK